MYRRSIASLAPSLPRSLARSTLFGFLLERLDLIVVRGDVISPQRSCLPIARDEKHGAHGETAAPNADEKDAEDGVRLGAEQTNNVAREIASGDFDLRQKRWLGEDDRTRLLIHGVG